MILIRSKFGDRAYPFDNSREAADFLFHVTCEGERLADYEVYKAERVNLNPEAISITEISQQIDLHDLFGNA